MDSLQTSARLFIQDGGVSARGWRQNTPALHAKTQGATRVQQLLVNALNRIYGVHLRTKIIENKRQFEVQKLDYPCRNLVV